MAKPETYAMPRAPVLRCVQPSTIALVPGWGERLVRAWQALLDRFARRPTIVVIAPRGAAAARLPAAPRSRQARWDVIESEVLSEMSPHMLADIGAPDEYRARAARDEELRRQRLLELEQGHRTYQDVRW